MIFEKMKGKALRASKMRFEVHGSEIFADRTSGFADIVVELRKAVYWMGAGSSVEAEPVSAEEGESLHFIGSLADFPICVARFHTLRDAATHQITAVVIDRFGVLPSHRGQGLAKKCAEGLVADIRSKLADTGTALAGVRLILKISREIVEMSLGSALIDKLRSSYSASLLESGYDECQPFPSPESFVSFLVPL